MAAVPHSPHRPFDPGLVAAICAEHVDREGSLIPILHEVQRAFGYVPAEVVPVIAGVLNISRADVHGVVTFYHDFRHEPAGRRVLKLCAAEACQARGGDAVVAEAEETLGVPLGSTTADGQVTLEATYCLGLCASGPAAMLDGRPVGRLDQARLSALLREAAA